MYHFSPYCKRLQWKAFSIVISTSYFNQKRTVDTPILLPSASLFFMKMYDLESKRLLVRNILVSPQEQQGEIVIPRKGYFILLLSFLCDNRHQRDKVREGPVFSNKSARWDQLQWCFQTLYFLTAGLNMPSVSSCRIQQCLQHTNQLLLKCLVFHDIAQN